MKVAGLLVEFAICLGLAGCGTTQEVTVDDVKVLEKNEIELPSRTYTAPSPLPAGDWKQGTPVVRDGSGLQKPGSN